MGQGQSTCDKVSHFIGKRELQRNLFTTSLVEANKRKHKVVAEFKEMIHHAEMRISGEFHELSKNIKSDKLHLSIESLTKTVIQIFNKHLMMCLKQKSLVFMVKKKRISF